MRVEWLNREHTTYTGNAYLVRGDWNALDDLNTIIDPGRDPVIFETLDGVATGAGKSKVDQVILTHSHFDHAELLPDICRRWRPRVHAASPRITQNERRCGLHEECDRRRPLEHGQRLRLGETECVALRAHAHSHDSMCIYCEASGILFTGDAPLPILSGAPADVPDRYIDLLRWLAARHVESIYPGHGMPMLEGGHELILATLRYLEGSRDVPIAPPSITIAASTTTGEG